MLIPTQDFPHFYYMLGGNLGTLLYGDVSVMGFIEYSSVFNSFQVVSLFFFVSEPSGSLK